MTTPILTQYTMTAQLNGTTPPFQPCYWVSYNTPDYAGTYCPYQSQIIAGTIAIASEYNINNPNIYTNVPYGPAGGDLAGNYPNPEVVGLMNNPLNLPILGPGQDQYVLTWVNADGYWEAQPAQGGGGGSPTGPAGGDLGGDYPNPIVNTSNGNNIVTDITSAGGDLIGTYPNPSIQYIQGYQINVSFPNFGDVLWWNGSEWVNDNTLYSTVQSLVSQVNNLAIGLGFALPVSGPNVPNVYFDGTTLSTVTT